MDGIIPQHIVAEVVAECAEILGIPATTNREVSGMFYARKKLAELVALTGYRQ